MTPIDTTTTGQTFDFLRYKMRRDDPTLATLRDYWDHLRDGKAVPARAAMDPRVIQSSLADAFVLDRTRPGTVRFRVAGQNLNLLMGMEVRGMPIRAFFELSDRRKLMEHVEACFTTPAVLEVDLTSEDTGRPDLAGRMLILPLTDHEGFVTKALGCLVTKGLVGEPPRRFTFGRAQLTPVRETVGAGASQTSVTGMAEAQSPYRPAPVRVAQGAAEDAVLSSTDVPYLKLVRP